MNVKTVRSSLLFTPTSIPNAIPGFSTKVRRRNEPIISTLSPYSNPLTVNPRKEKPCIRSFVIWSKRTTPRVTNRTRKINYFWSCFFTSTQCCVCGTARSLSLGIRGQVLHNFLGSSIHSTQIP